ncbi:hypothetical protein CC79DRAFT_50061 [Sarocladium strictum]
MKTATIATIALAAAAQASPLLGLGKDNNGRKGLLGGLLDLDLSLDLDLDLELGLGGGKTDYFTSTYSVLATPNQVVDANNEKTGGLKGAKGLYKFGINSEEDVICYKITLFGFEGEYQSPANTATHIHESAKGLSGPPRIAFPNPKGGAIRVSKGCLKGPFETGVKPDGTNDSGLGFTLKQIEENPSAFNADVHSSKAVPGAVRGQLS